MQRSNRPPECATHAIDADAWLRTLSDDDSLFLLHHESQAILADPAITADDRAKVAAELAALPSPPCIDKQRARVLIVMAADFVKS